MTTYLPPLSISGRAPAAATKAHPARWLRRHRDGKIALLAGIESLGDCQDRDLVALAAAADIVDVPSGTVLGSGGDLAHFWWMPVDGWLLVSSEGSPAITVPSGWSWAAPTRPVPPGTRLTALRGGRVLSTSMPRLMGTLDDFPRLATAIRSTLVVPGHV